MQSSNPAGAKKWKVRIITFLAGWLVAFVIVYTILLLFGHQIESQSPAVGALIFTGIMVPAMDVIMPRLRKVVVRYTGYEQKR